MAVNRITGEAAEVLNTGAASNARVTGVEASVLNTGATSTVRTTGVAVQALVSIAELGSDYDSDLTGILKTNTLIIDSGSGSVSIPHSDGFLKVEIWGAGGGAAGFESSWEGLFSGSTVRDGSNGGNTAISTLSMTANGGVGGKRYDSYRNFPTYPGSSSPTTWSAGTTAGAGGTASGGDVNTTGAAGSAAVIAPTGGPPMYTSPWGAEVTDNFYGTKYALPWPELAGRDGVGGGSVRPLFTRAHNFPTGQYLVGLVGDAPGGGGTGPVMFWSASGGFGTSGGGQGGYSSKEWQQGDSDYPTGSWSYAVGAGGAGGIGSGNLRRVTGGNGANGRIKITYQTWLSAESESDGDWISEGESDGEIGSSSDGPAESDSDDSGVDLFPGYPRREVPPYADFDSIFSRGNRYGMGLIAATTESPLSPVSPATEGFDGNYGNAAGNGPYLGGGSGITPGTGYLWWTTSRGVWLRGIRFVDGSETDTDGVWSVWGGFEQGGTMVPLSDSFQIVCVDNGLRAECVVDFAVPEDPNDLDFTYFELRLDNSAFSAFRIAGDIELLIAHSTLDGGNRTTGEKRIYVTTTIPMQTSFTNLQAIINGYHLTDNGGGGESSSGLRFTSATVGQHLTFEFPREVAMREAVLEIAGTSEILDSSDGPTVLGEWQWQGSDDGTTWTDVGPTWHFAPLSVGSDGFNLAPSPQSFDSSEGSSDEYVRFRRWRMELITGPAFATPANIYQMTFNLADMMFGHSDSDIQGGSGDSDESDFESSGDVPSSIDSSGGSSGSSSDSGGGSSGASDSGGSSGASDSGGSSGASDSGGSSGGSDSGTSSGDSSGASASDSESEPTPQVPFIQATVVSVVT